MKRTLFLAALLLAGALPALAQTSELGVIVGGSRRFVDGAAREDGVEFSEGNFSFSNNAFDIYWRIPIEEDLALKFRAGRIETPVAFAYSVAGNPNVLRKDVDGEVDHAEVAAEYEFSEVFGSSYIGAGLGMYRQSGPGFDSTTSAGAHLSVGADFPMTKRYGIVLDGTYHWVRSDFQPRFLTIGAGVRVSF